MKKAKDLPVEETGVLLLRFTHNTTPQILQFVKDRLSAAGLVVAKEEHRPSSNPRGSSNSSQQLLLQKESETVCLALTAPRAVLEQEAEHHGYVKRTVDGIASVFSVAGRLNFVGISQHSFFSLAERAQLIQERLDFIRVVGADQSDDFSKDLDNLGLEHDHGGSATLRHVLEENDIVDVVSPLHDPVEREILMWQTVDLGGVCPCRKSGKSGGIFSPVEKLRDYYGPEIALYFLWVDFMTSWLLVPAAAGIVLYFARMYNGDTIDDCELTPYYGLGVFVWAVLFLRFYQQHEARTAWSWGTYSGDAALVVAGDGSGCSSSNSDTRAEFEGQLRVSPITGRTEKYFPRHRRLGRYLVSAAVTGVLLLGAFVVMICSLNLQGYIQPSHDRARWPADFDHPFYIEFFAQYSVTGGLFDPASNYMSLIPVVLHVAVILTLNAAYSHVAEKLTEWENHETVVAHENSVILKRFLWEAFDAYVGLFYLTIYEQDIAKLRAELVAVFNVDTFRRIFVEMIVPRTMQVVESWVQSRRQAATAAGAAAQQKADAAAAERKDSTSGASLFHKPSGQTTDGEELQATHANRSEVSSRAAAGIPAFPLFDESNLQEYDSFDDYLEMTIQFGYITLFASAYPLAACLGVLANLVEVRSDGFKLARICRKPRSFRKGSVGTWLHLMTGIVVLSALTNVYIFGFTSQQLMQYAPSWFVIEEDGDQGLVAGSGRYVVMLVFVIEHAMLLLGLLIAVAVPAVPDDVTEQMKHRAFIIARDARALRLRQIQSCEEDLATSGATKEQQGSPPRGTEGKPKED